MQCGLGIRPELFNQVLEQKPALGFLEAHSENYFGDSLTKAKLLELREHYPISLHGVGLSLGRADHLDQTHLTHLKRLVDELDPMIVSEHLAWSAYSHRHVPDLLPLPLTDQALGLMCQHIDDMQQVLGRQVLVENPSNYLLFDQLQIPEPEFLNALAERTGCGLLVDLNNIHVSAINVGRDPNEYLDALNSDAIGQYHLAGYTEVKQEQNGQQETLLIDTHNQPVYDPVWSLFEAAVHHHGPRPTLFEWDSDFPAFEVLLNECEKANARLLGAPSSKHIAKSDNVESIELVKPEKVLERSDIESFQRQFLDDVFALHAEHSAAHNDHRHRISVYQNNFFGAMQEYLAEVYPATSGVVGEEFFKQMVQVLVQLHAPSEGNLHNYGAQMSDIIEHFEGLEALPYLHDLLRYEWALHAAYYADHGDVLDPAEVQEDQLLTLDISLNDTVEVIESSYPIYEIHRQSLPDFAGEVSISLDQSQDALLVYKQNHKVYTVQLTEPLLVMLKEIEKTQNLLQAIESLSGSIESNQLSTSLSFLFEKQLLCHALTKQVETANKEPVLH